MDRRARTRVAPQIPQPVRLILPSKTAAGILWDVSPFGAKLFFEPSEIDGATLAEMLGSDSGVWVDVDERKHAVRLVWYGEACDPRPGERRNGLAVGVEFSQPSLLSELPESREPEPLSLAAVRHRSVRELRVAMALRDLFLAVGGAEFSLDSTLQLLCEKIREVSGAEVVDFWALDDGQAVLRAQAGAVGLKVGVRMPQGRGSLAENFPMLKSRLQKGEQLFTNDLPHSRLAAHPWVKRFGIRSAMIIPVFGREVDLGILAFGHCGNPYAFGPRQQADAEIFASQAALFFEREKMHRNLQDSAQFLEAMNRIALAFHQRLHVDQVLEVICAESRALFQVDIATIFLRENHHHVQRAAAGMSVRASCLEAAGFDLPEPALVERGEGFFINDFGSHPLAQADLVRRFVGKRPPARSVMVVPIRENERVLGSLTLADRDNPVRFSNRDLEKGKLLAEQAAQAIVNARLYERLEQSRRIIRQQDRFHILGELAGVVSHEIKNALVPLRTLVDLLPQRYDDPGFREWYAKTVRQEVERMHGLLAQLSRFRSAEHRAVERAAPADVLKSVIDLLKPEAASRQIRLEHEERENLPAIEVVSDEIRQVLLNLILNALQAVEEKGTVRVGVRRSDDGDGVLFWVSDTGPGIEPGQVEKIFDPLYTTKQNGSGLGLAVARDVIRKYGGAIRVENVPGEGATFQVLLPGAAVVDQPPVVH